MSFLKWIKENVFDWSSQPPSRFTRPPEHDPGYYNRQRAKQANKRLHSRLAGTAAKKVKALNPPAGEASCWADSFPQRKELQNDYMGRN